MTEEGKQFFEFVKQEEFDKAAKIVKLNPDILAELDEQQKFFAEYISIDNLQQARVIAISAVKPSKNIVSASVFCSSLCCCLLSLIGGISFGFIRGDIFFLAISTSFSLAVAACFINQCGNIWCESADRILDIAQKKAHDREMDSARSSDDEFLLGEQQNIMERGGVNHVENLRHESANQAVRR